MKRRHFLASTTALSALATLAPHFPAGAATAMLGQGQPFDRDWLVSQARDLASRPYEPPPEVGHPALRSIGWDDYQAIRFREEHSLWQEDDLAFRVRLFHLGLYFQHKITISEVVDGVARPIAYTREMFDYGPNRFDPPLPADLGFAGFRLQFHTDWEFDMAAFLGASYFRAVGETRQYGLSARGLAIDTGQASGEEFPIFRAFWLERPAPGATTLRVHALLDSDSIAGAYTFDIAPGATTVMDVAADLFPRKTIRQLGVAPLTSMYQHGENDRRVSDDFRPEIHDSDGLAILTGSGERIWRPLVNPTVLRQNSFMDENPRGFGLLQRDRDFDNYQDDGVYYDRRPNLWIEPYGSWGRGTVQLVEIPTGGETFDNIVAYWVPEQPAEPGRQMSFAYRMYWGSAVPDIHWPVARVIATRIGVGGIPGQEQTEDSRKFVVDFRGGDLALLNRDAKVEPVITVSRGRIKEPAARPIRELGGWRANFDLVADGPEPIDLRLYLRFGDTALTETWIYQWAWRPLGG